MIVGRSDYPLCGEERGRRRVGKRSGEDPRLRICEGYCRKNHEVRNVNVVPARWLQYMKDPDNVVFLPYLQPWRGKHTRLSHKPSSSAQQNPSPRLPKLSFQPMEPVPQLSEVWKKE